ncbi:MAG: hypothetical protein R2792_14965 [Saprospiraceae bacterium]
MHLKRTIGFLVLGAFGICLIAFACQKDREQVYNLNTNGWISDRTLTDEVILKGSDGHFYSIYSESVGNSINIYKRKVSASNTDSIINGGLFLVSEASHTSLGLISFMQDKSYYYSNLAGDEVVNITSWGGVEAECFCEEADPNPEVPGIPSSCTTRGVWSNGNLLVWCINEEFCLDCDWRVCNPTKTISESGSSIIIEAENVRYFESYFSGNIRMDIEKRGDTTFVTRTQLPTASDPVCIYNHTNLAPQGDYLDIPSNSSYWFIPFNPTEIKHALNGITDDPTCFPDTDKGCQSHCELQVDENNCTECVCFPYNEDGDCDMKIGSLNLSSGGVILESQIVIIN